MQNEDNNQTSDNEQDTNASTTSNDQSTSNQSSIKIIQTTVKQNKNNHNKLMITKIQKADLQILNKLLTIKQTTQATLLT